MFTLCSTDCVRSVYGLIRIVTYRSKSDLLPFWGCIRECKNVCKKPVNSSLRIVYGPDSEKKISLCNRTMWGGGRERFDTKERGRARYGYCQLLA